MALRTEQPLDYAAPSAPEPDAALLPARCRPAWRAAGLVFVLCLLMNLPFLGMTPLAGTEGHRALTGHEMVRSGQWLVPMLYGRPYLAKPPLHYWLIATVETLTGRADVWGWRLPGALTGATLCAVVCLFASRWFGRAAGWVAGGCTVGMIAIWGEHQVADIDSTNTLAATLAALCGVELLFGRPGRLWMWEVAAGFAVGATLMAKGPGGLPIIVGVWGWAAAGAVRDRRIGRLASPRYWGPPLIGASLFGAYAFAAWLFLRRRGMLADLSGVKEGAQSLYPASLKQVGLALEVPVLLLTYALPVSLALPLWFALPVRRTMDEPQRRLAAALAAAAPIGWGVCLLSGLTNPRYGYPTLPALCPLAGAVAAAAVRAGGNAAEWLRRIAIGSAVALAGAAVVLAAMAWKQPNAKPFLAAAAVLSVATAAWVARGLPRSWRAAGGLLLLPVLVSVPFGFQRSWARTPTSGLSVAQELVRRAGERPTVALGMGLTFKPEIFYYAGAHTTAYLPPVFDPEHVPPGTWLFMDNTEYARWQRQVGSRLIHDKLIKRGGESVYYLGWYGPPSADVPATSQPQASADRSGGPPDLGDPSPPLPRLPE